MSIGSGVDDTLRGGAGADHFVVGPGTSHAYGEGGNDSLEVDLYAPAGSRLLDGGAGDDTLQNAPNVDEDGNDTFLGGAGDDLILVTGAGNLVVAGAGADTVDLERSRSDPRSGSATIYLGDMPSGTGPVPTDDDIDVIQVSAMAMVGGLPLAQVHGFRAGAGGDRIRLGFLADFFAQLFPGNAHPFTGNHLRLVQDGVDTRLQADTTGSGFWRDLLLLRDVVASQLTADNFIPAVSPAGTASPVTFGGTEGGDSVSGGDGNDSLLGLAGDDTLDGGFAGDDTLAGGLGMDSLQGLDGNDLLVGDETSSPSAGERDTLDGGAGSDTLLGGGGADVLFGGAGDDTLSGEDGSDSIEGGAGADVLDGGLGNDTLDGGEGADTVRGGEGDDFLRGYIDGHPNLLDGGAGNDTMGGGDGDTLDGGDGADTISIHGAVDAFAGEGDDSVWIGSGTALVVGGAGNDTLRAEGTGDTLDGGEGDDLIELSHSGHLVIAGPGADRVVLMTSLFGYGATGVIYLGDWADPSTGPGVPDGQQDTLVLTPHQDFSVSRPPPVVHGFGAGAGGDVLDFSRFSAGKDPFAAGEVRFDAIGDDLVAGVRTERPSGLVVFEPIAILKDVAAESLSASNIASGWKPAINHPALAQLTITGEARQGTPLAAALAGVDADGMPSPQAITYQWYASGSAIEGATSATFTPGQLQVNREITVRAAWLDGAGNLENVLSAKTGLVADVNDAPTGTATITGQPKPGATLTASHTISDPDGFYAPLVQWKWLVDGLPTPFNSGADFLVHPMHLGRSITVTASYRDYSSTDESFTSAPLTVAANGLHGMIYSWKGHHALTDVTVSARPSAGGEPVTQSTGAFGVFSFEGLSAQDHQLELSRTATQSFGGSAITSADALAALRLAVGVNPNADPDGPGPKQAPKVSPYQYLAADVNGDGKVNSADALGILRMAISAPNAPAAAWRFVRESQDLWDESANKSLLTATNAALPQPATAATGDMANHVAVLRGDVNGSWTANAVGSVDVTLPGYFQLLSSQLGVPTDVWGA